MVSGAQAACRSGHCHANTELNVKWGPVCNKGERKCSRTSEWKETSEAVAPPELHCSWIPTEGTVAKFMPTKKESSSSGVWTKQGHFLSIMCDMLTVRGVVRECWEGAADKRLISSRWRFWLRGPGCGVRCSSYTRCGHPVGNSLDPPLQRTAGDHIPHRHNSWRGSCGPELQSWLSPPGPVQAWWAPHKLNSEVHTSYESHLCSVSERLRPRWRAPRPGSSYKPHMWNSEDGRPVPWPAGCGPGWA